MTPRCLKFVDGFVLSEECDYPRDKTGQLSNDPSDPGGLTKWGIDQRSHPDVDIRNLTHDGALQIYGEEWAEEHVDNAASKVGEAFFDAAVNCGLTRARQFLRAADDVGDQIDARVAFYRRLAKARPVLAKYLPDWLGRTTRLRAYLGL